jgi:hypothetical protein
MRNLCLGNRTEPGSGGTDSDMANLCLGDRTEPGSGGTDSVRSGSMRWT